MVRSKADVDLQDLEELLAPFARTTGPRYVTADWLLSSNDTDIWTTRFESLRSLDWRVALPDGTLLTDRVHARLLSSLRAWLIARFHVDFTGGQRYARRSAWNIAVSNLHCIDYLLLRSDTLGILSHGLSALSENDLKAMISELSSSSHVAVSVYQWPTRVATHLRTLSGQLSATDMAKARAVAPDFDLTLPAAPDRLTDLNDEEIVRARAWMLANGGFVERHHGARYSAHLRTLSREIYRGTLFGSQTLFPMPPELCIGVHLGSGVELRRAPVSSRDRARAQRGYLSLRVRNLAVLTLLHGEGYDAPTFSPDGLQSFAATLDTRESGRYATLPQAVVFLALRRALELAMSSGDAIVDSYLNLAGAAHAAGQSIAGFLNGADITQFLTAECVQLGVTSWCIEPSNAGMDYGAPRHSRGDWFSLLRKNAGLFELLQVLYGAIFIVVGTLMARRVGELTDLVAGDYLDVSGTRLVFENRKSGFDDLREREARPIPPIAVRLLRMLQRIQDGLVAMGAADTPGPLFATPMLQGVVGARTKCARGYPGPLDRFCDWAQLPVDAEGRRYYIRQHQLRRFFAMLFFWGDGFGGLDTLRWFLGHTDPAHLWHYITESTPGAVLRSVAADWAVQSVASGAPEFEALASLVETHFGTRDISVIDSEALTAHLEDLMEEGVVRIEPQFLDRGREYRIAVLINMPGDKP